MRISDKNTQRRTNRGNEYDDDELHALEKLHAWGK